MKKQTLRLPLGILFPYALFSTLLLILIVVTSCKSHSVRDIRAARDPYGDLISQSVKVKVPKTTEDALVKDLFMVNKYPNIELPYIPGSEGKGARVVSEEVTFTHAEVIPGSQSDPNKTTNLNEVQHLNEVVVTAKSRFTPEQNGRVNVDFVVKVPRELLSTNFRITLSPKLFHNDSIIPLQTLILKGDEFASRQKQSYDDYNEYLASIVRKSQYDSVFVDHDGVREDINFHQKFYYDQYHKEWSKQTDYESWKTDKNDAEAMLVAKRAGLEMKVYRENIRKARVEAMKEFTKGKDTTGFHARYMKKYPKPEFLQNEKRQIEQRDEYRTDFYKQYSKKAKEQIMRDWALGKDTIGAYARYMKNFDKDTKSVILDGEDLSKIPERFRDIYRSGRAMGEINNQVFTKEDSIAIAQGRYKFEDMALNEMKEERREEKMKELIIFPYERGMRLDTIIPTDRDFVYYYKQDYPVRSGMKSLRLTLNTTVDAVDRSRFSQPLSDTLSYFISSLSQLVDASLVTKTTTVHRDVYNLMTIYPKFAAKKAVFNVSFMDNKKETDKVLEAYNTFSDEGKLLMDSVMIRVHTSLDGSYDDNIELSMKRAEALKSYFVKALGGANVDMVFKTRFSGEDWNTLAGMIVKRNDLPNKSEILDMLTNAVNPDQCELDIKKSYPIDFKIISDSIYPKLNRADIIFNMTRPGMTEEITVNTEHRPDYAKALELLQDREYWKALEILSNYPDYNTALCLVCMGYNAKAFELLEQLKQTENTEYLLAILAIRSGNDSQAIEHLSKSCELDPSKLYRIPLDPEVAAFVSKHNLQSQLEQSSSAPL